MGIGYALAFVLTVVVAFPVLWFLGWGLDYLTGGPQRSAHGRH